MCEDTWRRLDADFDRIIGSLEVVAVDPGGNRPTAALAVEGRADIGREGRANVYEFKRPRGASPLGKFVQGGTTVAGGMNATRQTVPLRIRR